MALLWLLRLGKRLCLGRWDRGFYFFVTLTYWQIERVYGPQSPYPWASKLDGDLRVTSGKEKNRQNS